MAVEPFRIDVLDASGGRLGDGPILTATELVTRARLDAIGALAFPVPASDPRAALIQAGRQLDVFVQDDPTLDAVYLGRFHYAARTFAAGVWQIRAWDGLRELARRSVYFNRTYVNQNVAAVVDDVVRVVSGWSTEVDTGIGNTTVSFEGEHVLPAVDELRDRWGQHYRLKAGAKVLQFGAFGADSGVVLTNLPGQAPVEIARRRQITIIPPDGLRLVEETDEVFNRVIALGGGEGVTAVTMELATAGAYTVKEGTNDDGSSFWYIEDSTSISNYGLTEKVLKFDSIRPITNSHTNRVNAANAVKLAAEAILGRHLAPRTTYSVRGLDLRTDVRPGDKVRLTYTGVVERLDGQGEYAYLDVDEDVYVLEVEVARGAGGRRTVSLEVATTAQRRTTDSDVLIDVIHDLRAQRLHVRPSITKVLYGPYQRELDGTHPAIFSVPLGDEVLALNYALLRIQTRPFRAVVVGAASGGGATSSTEAAHRHKMFTYIDDWSTPSTWSRYRCKGDAGGTGNTMVVVGEAVHDYLYTEDAAGEHSHTVPNHTHDLVYGIVDDAAYPASIGVKIDGVDRTTELGGPWAVGGGGAAEIEVEITDILVNAALGLQQNHTIEVTCASGQGEAELSVRTLETVQAIAVS